MTSTQLVVFTRSNKCSASCRNWFQARRRRRDYIYSTSQAQAVLRYRSTALATVTPKVHSVTFWGSANRFFHSPSFQFPSLERAVSLDIHNFPITVQNTHSAALTAAWMKRAFPRTTWYRVPAQLLRERPPPPSLLTMNRIFPSLALCFATYYALLFYPFCTPVGKMVTLSVPSPVQQKPNLTNWSR